MINVKIADEEMVNLYALLNQDMRLLMANANVSFLFILFT